MKHFPSILLAFAALIGGASSARAQRDTIEILPVVPLPTITEKLTSTGKKESFDQISRSFEEQQLDVLNNTRKFQIISRADPADQVSDVLRASALRADKSKDFNLAGGKFLLVTSIADFEDQTDTFEQRKSDTTIVKRTIRLSIIAKIYDSSSGKLLESAENTVSKAAAWEPTDEVRNDTESVDLLARNVVKESADWVGSRVVDVIYPPKIIAKTDKLVTINRGNGTGVEAGQVWRVFAVGEELLDPDTKKSLGREEVAVGKVKITNVLPKFSEAEVLEDLGIDKGAILRK